MLTADIIMGTHRLGCNTIPHSTNKGLDTGRLTVMVLHVNRLNADMLDDLLRAFAEQKQYTFVLLDKAQADPAFATPDTFVGPYGQMWGYRCYRWAAERGVKVNGKLETEPFPWVVEYTKK